MCGRFTLRAPASTVAEQFGLLDAEPLNPRFNIAPTQAVAAVRLATEGDEPARQLVWLKWGLVPSWAKDAKIGNSLINARAESVADKPAFRAAFRRRRCLVAADGFYEWRRTGGKKQPYFIRLAEDRPFAFAGLWESWEGPEHSALDTCTLITTDANELMRPIHDRMPVILSPEHYARWLDPALQKPEHLQPLLRPYPSDAMLAYPVSSHVNNPRNEDAGCIAPAA
jgi:putative SOS response-associated peptidase YedK